MRRWRFRCQQSLPRRCWPPPLPGCEPPPRPRAELEVEFLSTALKLGDGKLLDADGAAVVVHAGADDYESDPAGDAGGRIACGVIGG